MTVSNIRINEPAPAAAQPVTRSAEIIAEAIKTVFVTDARGRSIEVRRPSNVTRRNARKAISAESQTKPELFGEYMLVFLVASIDGTPVALPTNELQTEGVQDRLGDEGLVAVARAVSENFTASTDDVAGEAKNS